MVYMYYRDKFTREAYVAAYRRVIDAHAESFPHTRVFLNVGTYGEINDYAALRGCHFRQDGLTPRGPSANVGKLYYRPYSRRGVSCNYEYHSGYQAMQQKGWDLQTTVDVGLSDPISYMNTNIFSPEAWEDAPANARQLFVAAAKRIGYRFVITKLRVSSSVHLDGKSPARLLTEHTWKNIGVAPCYESYAMEFTLHDGQGRVVARRLHYPRRPTTLWWPGEEITERTLISVPADVPPGEYSLKVSVFLPRCPGRVSLGIAGRDADGRYLLGTIPGVRISRRTASVYEQGFVADGHRWTPASGIQQRVDTAVFHGGPASLQLQGSQSGSWNYTSHQLGFPVMPGSKYRLTCWLRIDELEPAAVAPYMKIGLTNGDGDHLQNCHTSRYDMSRSGTWQQLQGTFETPLDTAGGHLALERGAKEQPTRIQAWLDDVQLELLEAP